MYRTILLCYDGSPDGRKALHEGTEIAQHFATRTHLLAIVPVITGGDEVAAAPELIDGNCADFEAILQAGVDRLREAGIEVTGHLAQGRPIEVIAKFARDLDVDLIVVGHRHQSALARWWRGSLGSSLVDRAPCSIMVAVDHPGHPYS